MEGSRLTHEQNFQDGNGRVGRLILLKECLKYNITPFVIAENFKQFYYLGLSDWRHGSRLHLMNTCRTGQDVFVLGFRQFGDVKLAEKAVADIASEEKVWKGLETNDNVKKLSNYSERQGNKTMTRKVRRAVRMR